MERPWKQRLLSGLGALLRGGAVWLIPALAARGTLWLLARLPASCTRLLLRTYCQFKNKKK